MSSERQRERRRMRDRRKGRRQAAAYKALREQEKVHAPATVTCLRCKLPMATREAWWADDGEVPTYCRCAYPLPSEDGKALALNPRCYVQLSP